MSATRPTPWRLLCLVSLMLWLVCGLHVTDSPAQPKGKMTWAIHFTIAPTFLSRPIIMASRRFCFSMRYTTRW